jgi:acylphosphatase
MRIHVVVRGRVQGVGFRWFVRETARALDLAGWVRNRPDSSVEIEADGSEAAIQSFRRALAEGPGGAVVSALDDVALSGEVLGRPFTILR